MKPIFLFLIQLAFLPIGTAQITCNAEHLFTSVQDFSVGLATDGDMFWVAGSNNVELKGINLHDELGNYLQTIYPDGQMDIDLSGLTLQEDTLYGISEQISKLYKMNKRTGELYEIFEVPFQYSEPNNWGISFDGTHLFVVEYGFPPAEQSYLYKMNPINGEVLDTINVDLILLLPVEIIDGVMIGISLDTDELYEINLETGASSYLIDWCVNDPWDMARSPQGELFGIGRLPGNDVHHVFKVEGIALTTNLPSLRKDVNITLFPNPVKEMLYIETTTMNSGTLTITNSLGAICLVDFFQNGIFEKNIADLPAGTYFLHLTDGKQRVVKRVVKV